MGARDASRLTAGGIDVTEPLQARCFYCGIVAGSLQASIFNPYDRALFLMHLHKRPFLTMANFRRPYEGFHQSVLHRIISGGMYFPLEDSIRRRMHPGSNSPVMESTIAGMTAGSVIAILTNPLAAVKYQSWRNVHRGQMFKTAKDMLKRGGLVSFSRAIHLTIVRDIVWGGTFAALRNWLPGVLSGIFGHNKDSAATSNFGNKPGLMSFTSNMIAGGCGTIFSAPLNYARNIRYGHNVAHDSKSVLWIVRDLMHDANVHYSRNKRSRFTFVLGRLAIGWGTLRVALGLAFSSQVYLECCNLTLA